MKRERFERHDIIRDKFNVVPSSNLGVTKRSDFGHVRFGFPAHKLAGIRQVVNVVIHGHPFFIRVFQGQIRCFRPAHKMIPFFIFEVIVFFTEQDDAVDSFGHERREDDIRQNDPHDHGHDNSNLRTDRLILIIRSSSSTVLAKSVSQDNSSVIQAQLLLQNQSPDKSSAA